MPISKTKSEYWGRPKNAPIHPYAKYEGTALWHVVKKAIADLEANQDLSLNEWHQYVVGYVCKKLVTGELVNAKAKRKRRNA